MVGSIAASFANAIRGFYEAKYSGNHVLSQEAVAWLKGEKIRTENKRALNVAGSITRKLVEFFKALLYMIRSAGYNGLVVIYEEVKRFSTCSGWI